MSQRRGRDVPGERWEQVTVVIIMRPGWDSMWVARGFQVRLACALIQLLRGPHWPKAELKVAQSNYRGLGQV